MPPKFLPQPYCTFTVSLFPTARRTPVAICEMLTKRYSSLQTAFPNAAIRNLCNTRPAPSGPNININIIPPKIPQRFSSSIKMLKIIKFRSGIPFFRCAIAAVQVSSSPPIMSTILVKNFENRLLTFAINSGSIVKQCNTIHFTFILCYFSKKSLFSRANNCEYFQLFTQLKMAYHKIIAMKS